MENLSFYNKSKIIMNDRYDKPLWDSSTNFVEHVNEGMRTLNDGIKILKDLGFNPWISAGTALGFVRNHTFIPHDTDIDLEVFIEKPNVDLVKELNMSLLNNNFGLIRTVYYGGGMELPMQIAAVSKDKIILDIYFYYQNPLKKNQIINFTDSGVMLLRKDMIDNMDTALSLWGDKYPVPGPREDYMVFRYGSGWKTPKKKKTLWWDECPCLIKADVAEKEFNKGLR